MLFRSARELETEILNENKLIRRKRTTENVKNDLLLGRLDEEPIRRLNQIIDKD